MKRKNINEHLNTPVILGAGLMDLDVAPFADLQNIGFDDDINFRKIILEAAKDGDITTIKDLIPTRVRPRSQRLTLVKAVRLAVKYGHLNVLEYLTQYWPDYIQDDELVIFAIKHGHVRVMQYLVEQGVDLAEHREHGNALELAARYGQLPLVKHLVEDQKMDPANNKNKTLFAASSFGYASVVQYLLSLDNPAIHPIDFQNSFGQNAFERACENGHLEVVRVLFESGTIDLTHSTLALSGAAENGHSPVVQFLLESGADATDAYDLNESNRSLILAVYQGHTETVELLLKYGADPCAEDENDDNTVLMTAAMGGNVEMVEVLLKYGADPSLGENEAIREAFRKGHTDVVDCIYNHYVQKFIEEFKPDVHSFDVSVWGAEAVERAEELLWDQIDQHNCTEGLNIEHVTDMRRLVVETLRLRRQQEEQLAAYVVGDQDVPDCELGVIREIVEYMQDFPSEIARNKRLEAPIWKDIVSFRNRSDDDEDEDASVCSQSSWDYYSVNESSQEDLSQEEDSQRATKKYKFI